jgi:hypothetical protein
MSKDPVGDARSPRVVLPGYLSKPLLPEVADILYFPRLLYWLPTGFTDTEYDAISHFPTYCSEQKVDLPDSAWNLLSWYREADKRALDAAKILLPLRNANLISYTLPIYGRGQHEIELAKKAITEDRVLDDSLSLVPFDACLFAREFVGHALFGVFVEAGYQGSINVFRNSLQSEVSLTTALGAATINRISAMLRTGMIPVVYDRRWIPLLKLSVQIASLVSKELAIPTRATGRWNIPHLEFLVKF